MSVNVSGLENAIRDFAREKAECLGDGFVSQAMAEAPSRSGDLIASIRHDGAVDTGSSVTVHAHCDAPYARFVEHGRGPERATPHHAFNIDGVLVKTTRAVEPNPFWQRTVEAWLEIVAECGQ